MKEQETTWPRIPGGAAMVEDPNGLKVVKTSREAKSCGWDDHIFTSKAGIEHVPDMNKR